MQLGYNRGHPSTLYTPSMHSRVHPHTSSWAVRQQGSGVRELRSLVDMARLILDGEITIDDEISAGDGRWVRMIDVIEPEAFGLTLLALGHLDASRPLP